MLNKMVDLELYRLEEAASNLSLLNFIKDRVVLASCHHLYLAMPYQI